MQTMQTQLMQLSGRQGSLGSHWAMKPARRNAWAGDARSKTELQGLDGVGCQRPTRRSFRSWQSLFLGSAGCLAAFELPPALDVQ